MSASKRWLAVLLLIVGLLLVLTCVWVSSRDNTRATRESGPELGEPSLPPVSPERDPQDPVSPSSPSPSLSKPSHIEPGVPVRLKIGTINVDAPVDSGGIMPDGTQQVPESMFRTSWYNGGSKPGQPGNTVIVGHTWSKGDGVFDDLSQLTERSRIELRTSAGERIYQVTSVGSIPLAEFGDHAAAIYSTTGKSGLVLMTCGDWNGSAYEATTVVYAELIS